MQKSRKILSPEEVQQNLKSNILEVEVIIPEDVVKKESHLKDIYSNGKLKYDFGDELPENVKDEITDLIKSSKVDDLVQFNPLLVSLAELQKFKTLKWDPDAKNERDYIDSNKMIGSFNTSIKTTTDLLKKEPNNYIKKVNAIRDFFLTEATTTRNVLQENFKPFLEEKQRKKEEAEARKNKEMIEANERLTQQNKEQADKLKNQMRDSKIISIEGEIGKIVLSATSGLSVLNEAGLLKLKDQTKNLEFKSILSDAEITEFGFTPSEVNEFINKFNSAVDATVNSIDISINNIRNTEKLNSIPQTPKEDVPFEAPKVPLEMATDAEKINMLHSILVEFKTSTATFDARIKELTFEDEGLSKVHNIIAGDSFKQIVEWSQKLDTWVGSKKDKYLTHINSI